MNTFNLKLPVYLYAILALTAVVYCKARFIGFWSMDDFWMVNMNPHLRSVDYDTTMSLWFSMYFNQHSPINTLFYMISYRLSGFDPVTFHTASIILHVINVGLVYIFLQKLQEHILDGKDPVRARNISLLTTLLFAIHPINVESVAWISASKVIVYAFFCLIGLILYIEYRVSGRIRFLVVCMACFILSVCSKEQAIIFPVLLVLLDLVALRRFNYKLLLEKIPFFAFSLFYGLITYKYSGSITVLHFSFFKHILIASHNITSYIVNLVYPVNLKALYAIPPYLDETLPLEYYISFTGMTLVSALVLYYILSQPDKDKYIIFSILFFFANLILSTHIIPMNRPAIIADRYVYMSSVGFFLLLSYCFYNWYEQQPKYHTLTKLASTLCVGLFLFLTFRHIDSWDQEAAKAKARQEKTTSTGSSRL